MKTAIILVSTVFGCLLSSMSTAADITNAIAAHLATHRLERLVTLGKIDGSFQTKFRELTLENIPHTQATEPAFKALLEQYPGMDGTKNVLEIIMNGTGKSLKDTVLPGATAEDAPDWPIKDAITLSELAQHHLLEKAQTDPALAPYIRALSGFNISQFIEGGDIFARIDLRSSETEQKYRVILKTDGTVVTATIVSGSDQV